MIRKTLANDCIPLSRSRYATYFHLCAKTGLRPEEARALHPGDVDFRKRQIRVERALRDNRLKGTKTGETRNVDIAPALTLRLQNHLKRIREKL